jgi:hypothetical protein
MRHFQMLGQVLVHLEHGHLVLAEDAPELVIGHDLAAVVISEGNSKFGAALRRLREDLPRRRAERAESERSMAGARPRASERKRQR